MIEPVTVVELTRVFNISHGNKFDLNKMETAKPSPDGIAFVGRSGMGNGIVAFVEEVNDVTPYEAGTITVALGGAALSSFVQPFNFYTAQNIDILKPIEEMSLDQKLYYCLCIEANRFRYSTFGREANRTLKSLRVPALSSLPKWVKGTTLSAVKDLNRDLLAVIADD